MCNIREHYIDAKYSSKLCGDIHENTGSSQGKDHKITFPVAGKGQYRLIKMNPYSIAPLTAIIHELLTPAVFIVYHIIYQPW